MHQVSSASQTVSTSYLYNLSNQRTNATAADGSYWVYAYDDHGQVVSGKRYWADGTLVAGQQFEYGFDDIGNRTNTSSGGDDQGNNMRASSYTTNYQNEVTQLVVPSYEEIQGTANELATVTVNGLYTYRKGEYFRYELPVSNSSGAAYSAVSVISSITGLSDTTSGNVYSPRASEWCYYDDDGNLTYDGRWYYTWNAENRLIAMQAGWVTSGSQALRRRLEFKYDGKGRRIEKKIYKYNTSTYSFSDLLETWTYVYDGWNLIAEIRKAPYYDGIRRSYMWGPDLSGSMQGAGGVGGLLMITDHTGVSDEHHYVGYDGNGNVTVLVDANIGTVTGRYEYGPFGEPLRASGEVIAIENPFRFSTKFTDKESGYLYYGFRYYNPETGRWLNRDPIAEKGGPNIYGYVGNDPLSKYDPFGLCAPSCGPDVTDALNNTLDDVRQTFRGWSWTEKLSACRSLYVPISTARGAWFLTEIANLGYGTFQFPKPPARRGGKGCERTVKYAGRCYHASDVNYIMWGLVNSLCNQEFPKIPVSSIGIGVTVSPWSLTVAMGAVSGWKKYWDAPERHLQGAQYFTGVGYNAGLSGANPSSLGGIGAPVEETKCDPSTSSPCGLRKLGWQWKPKQLVQIK